MFCKGGTHLQRLHFRETARHDTEQKNGYPYECVASVNSDTHLISIKNSRNTQIKEHLLRSELNIFYVYTRKRRVVELSCRNILRFNASSFEVVFCICKLISVEFQLYFVLLMLLRVLYFIYAIYIYNFRTKPNRRRRDERQFVWCIQDNKA